MGPEIYVSTDIESDGPIPAVNSMLSFASAAFREDGTLIATFTRNLELLDDARPHPDTARFWAANPDAYAATRENCVPPEQAMREYVDWLERLPGTPVEVAYPVKFDGMFVHWYLHRFVGRSPLSHSGVDIKTMAMMVLGKGYRESSKGNWPQQWTAGSRSHTHVALDDAIEQGEQFCAILRAGRRLLTKAATRSAAGQRPGGRGNRADPTVA